MTTRPVLLLALCAITLFSAACVKNVSPSPDTDAELRKAYPDLLYVVGWGRAEERTEAEARAMDDVARQISSSIRSSHQSWIEETAVDGQPLLSALSRRQIEIESHFDRLELVDLLRDMTRRIRGQWEAVAVLDRGAAMETLNRSYYKGSFLFRNSHREATREGTDLRTFSSAYNRAIASYESVIQLAAEIRGLAAPRAMKRGMECGRRDQPASDLTPPPREGALPRRTSARHGTPREETRETSFQHCDALQEQTSIVEGLEGDWLAYVNLLGRGQKERDQHPIRVEYNPKERSRTGTESEHPVERGLLVSALSQQLDSLGLPQSSDRRQREGAHPPRGSKSSRRGGSHSHRDSGVAQKNGWAPDSRWSLNRKETLLRVTRAREKCDYRPLLFCTWTEIEGEVCAADGSGCTPLRNMPEVSAFHSRDPRVARRRAADALATSPVAAEALVSAVSEVLPVR